MSKGYNYDASKQDLVSLTPPNAFQTIVHQQHLQPQKPPSLVISTTCNYLQIVNGAIVKTIHKSK
jgi:hypothetical protein